jgi:hypothetical protein
VPGKIDQEPTTMAYLQRNLRDTLDRIVAGETTPANANAVVNITAAYLRTVKMQMDYAKQTGRTPNIPLLVTESTD